MLFNRPNIALQILIMETKISLIGTGSMGTALAKLLLKSGYSVTAWNRTISKAEILLQDGIIVAPTVKDAILESHIIIICVADYATTDKILKIAEVENVLKNTTIIQLSTGTPNDAKASAAWAKTIKAEYLDGAIMVTPSQMGHSEALMLLSGSEASFKKHETILKTLAPNTLYLGEGAGVASSLDLALLSYFFSALIGFSHAALICKKEGIDIGLLGTFTQNWSPAMGTIMKRVSDIIQSDNYLATESTINTCYVAMELIKRHAEEVQISDTYPKFATEIFKKAMQAGFSNEDGAAILKVL
jgi:3-hydroxyisobutyrate dehydrogenase-like beta-hydroxyacid dehydrogenase